MLGDKSERSPDLVAGESDEGVLFVAIGAGYLAFALNAVATFHRINRSVPVR